jgi:transposase
MGVVVKDARRLSPAAQEDLRRRAVAAVQAGKTQAEVSTVFQVAPKTVSRWMKAVRDKGNKGLKAGRRGRRPGEQKALTPRQEARLRRAVVGKCPDQLALPGMVWTRPAVRQLIRDWFGIGLSLVTVGKYLRSWGLSPQKPVRRAYEQNPEQVRQWLRVEYPAIAAKARKDNGVILWLDQTGFRSTAVVGTSWAPVGKTPVVAKTGKRFGVNAMIAISNRGELYFTCYTGSFTGPVFLTFCKRLVRHLDRKIHLIVDRHPVHRRVSVRDWLADNVAQIEMHLLPGYAPELNPVEILNADGKHHVAQANPTNQTELLAKVDAHLRRRQNQPGVVKAFFRKPEVRYAAC